MVLMLGNGFTRLDRAERKTFLGSSSKHRGDCYVRRSLNGNNELIRPVIYLVDKPLSTRILQKFCLKLQEREVTVYARSNAS